MEHNTVTQALDLDVAVGERTLDRRAQAIEVARDRDVETADLLPFGIEEEDVCLADFDADGATKVADEIGGDAVSTDVGVEADIKSLVDRLAATGQVREFLRGYPVAEALNWYDTSLLTDDLLKYLDPLWHADDTYRREFLDRVNLLLDDTDPAIFDELPPVEKRKWELVRARRLDELLQVLGDERQARRGPAPTRTQRLMRRVPESVRRMVPLGVRRRVLGSGR